MQRSSILAYMAVEALIAILLGVPATAQTIETTSVRAAVGSPLDLTLRVRNFDPGLTNTLSRDCLQAEVQQGEPGAGPQPLLWRNASRTADGDTLVALVSHQAVREPLLRIRVALLCGASFMREFTLLAEPPAEQPARATGPAKQPPRPRVPRPAPLATTPSASGAISTSLQPGVGNANAAPLIDNQRLGSRERQATAFTAQADGAAPAQAPSHAGRSSASPLTDAFVSLWHHDIQSVQEEQRQTRAALASMRARLERSEQDAWQSWLGLAALGAGASVATILWRTLVDARMQRMISRSASGWPAAVPGSAPTATTTSPARSPPTDVATPDVADNGSTNAVDTPIPWVEEAHVADQKADTTQDVTDKVPTRWPSSDFGQPTLNEDHDAELLLKVDTITASGYLGASVAVLENALQGRIGKSAGILLRLLDLYRTLNQPSNHERVGAEMAAIYNVQIPAIDAPDEGRSLAEHLRTSHHIAQVWDTDSATAQIAQVLIRPTRIEVLDLAAFREALSLHAMTLQQNEAAHTRASAPAPPVGNLDELPPLQWTGLEAQA